MTKTYAQKYIDKIKQAKNDDELLEEIIDEIYEDGYNEPHDL